MRTAGYYWVKHKGKWIVAEYMHDNIIYEWAIIGTDDILRKSDFAEIDERRIERTDKAVLPDEDYNARHANNTKR